MPSRSSSRCRLVLAGAFIAAIGWGGACENKDYLASQRLEMVSAAALDAEVLELDMPYRGILTLDFVLRNSGSDAVDFGLAVDVCNRCGFDEDCATDTTCLGATCPDGRVRCTVDDHCAEGTGAPVEGACVATGEGLCGAAGAPACSELRRTTETISAGGVLEGRFNEDDLGVGDRLHLELVCLSEGAVVCSAEMDMVVGLTQVACRDDADCASDEVCDLDRGICKGETSGAGCRVAAVGSGLGLALALGLMGLLWARTRWA